MLIAMARYTLPLARVAFARALRCACVARALRVRGVRGTACAYCARYIGQIEKKVRADKIAFSVKFEDCVVTRYLDKHPDFTEEEQHRYLTHPEVRVLQLA